MYATNKDVFPQLLILKLVIKSIYYKKKKNTTIYVTTSSQTHCIPDYELYSVIVYIYVLCI